MPAMWRRQGGFRASGIDAKKEDCGDVSGSAIFVFGYPKTLLVGFLVECYLYKHGLQRLRKHLQRM